MSGLGALPALALADFRDRVRRRSFLAVLAAAAYLGLETIRGDVVVAFDDYTGGGGSAWAGTLMAIVANTFLSLAGFWVVKGSVARDRATGVGQILAATPISKVAYTLAKTLSHLLVLASMVGVLWIAALVYQWRAPEATGFDLVAVTMPLLLFTLPTLAVVSALAVLFETVPFLARGFGNFVWFFLWSALLVLPLTTSFPDLFGLRHFHDTAAVAMREIQPGWDGSFRITLAGDGTRPVHTLPWSGFALDARLLGGRLLALLFALATALVAALPFDRFDPARRKHRAPARGAETAPDRPAAGRSETSDRRLGGLGAPSAPSAPSVTERDFGLLPLARHELRVALRAMPRWWRLGAAILLVGGALAPATARQLWLALGVLWPTLLWSGLGVRERESRVDSILAAAPLARRRQLPALLVAGFLAGLATTAGSLARILLAGDLRGAAAALAGLVAMPLLGLALGLLSRGARLFEGLFIAIWYIGPLQAAPGFDFAGATAAGVDSGTPYAYVVLGVAALATALVVERRRGAEAGARFA
ncbi:MAG: hypothetical protein H6511_07740 [Holophagales bacterium]|nr:hypothetical protein [Holophagales bacterium]